VFGIGFGIYVQDGDTLYLQQYIRVGTAWVLSPTYYSQLPDKRCLGTNDHVIQASLQAQKKLEESVGQKEPKEILEKCRIMLSVFNGEGEPFLVTRHNCNSDLDAALLFVDKDCGVVEGLQFAAGAPSIGTKVSLQRCSQEHCESSMCVSRACTELYYDTVCVTLQVHTWGFPVPYQPSKPLLAAGNVSGENPGVSCLSMPINPGNSGGPVLDKGGEVQGVIKLKFLATYDELQAHLDKLSKSTNIVKICSGPHIVDLAQIIHQALTFTKDASQLVLGVAIQADQFWLFSSSAIEQLVKDLNTPT